MSSIYNEIYSPLPAYDEAVGNSVIRNIQPPSYDDFTSSSFQNNYISNNVINIDNDPTSPTNNESESEQTQQVENSATHSQVFAFAYSLVIMGMLTSAIQILISVNTSKELVLPIGLSSMVFFICLGVLYQLLDCRVILKCKPIIYGIPTKLNIMILLTMVLIFVNSLLTLTVFVNKIEHRQKSQLKLGLTVAGFILVCVALVYFSAVLIKSVHSTPYKKKFFFCLFF